MSFPETRVSLIQRLADQRDSAAWMEFCAIYERAIFRIAGKYGLQSADASEVSQNVLLRVSRSIERFDPEKDGRFRSWLSRVARNATIDLLRRSRYETTGDSRLQQAFYELPAAQDESSLFDVEERQAQFRWAADRVRSGESESAWQAFWLTAVEGLSGEVVASRLNMSVGAVYVARCRTLAKIKKLIEPYRGEMS